MTDIKGRSFLSLKDFTPAEIRAMLDKARQFKQDHKSGISHVTDFAGKSIALLFEKTSTRTRCAFTVAAIRLGIHPEFLGKDDIQLKKKESVEDTAKVLGRMFDGIQFRGFSHDTVEELAEFAGVPIWNGLTDKYHPTQVLADFMTIEEQLGYLKGAKLAFLGEGDNNVTHSLMIGAALMGLDFRVGTPQGIGPQQQVIDLANSLIDKYQTGGRITITDDPNQAVEGVDAIYTDIWISMGEEDQLAERVKLLKAYQVNRELMAATGNPRTIFLHCLPAFHDDRTDFGKQVFEKYGLKEMEVTDEVFRSPASVVFDEAENRLYTIQAVMAMTL